MSNFTSKQIREYFIDFFKKNGHVHVQSSSLIPHNDPSLMFVNSGMVQFKDVFTGLESRDYTRATTSQKSVRAGGKHNDLDNVGYTARHHTFFEMLGNFSFGDYFKEEAIYYAWNLLTKDFGLDKSKLYVTIYHDDEESASYWKKISGFNDDKIIRISSNDNFWSMGDTGPCGPCSEIFYDHGDHIWGGLPGTAEQDGDRFIEIWNLVFMQYEQIDKDKRIQLPKKSVDTGMGLERIAAVIQGVHDNYDIDIFKELISTAESIIKVKAEDKAMFSYRVIADHLRSSSFLIADGVMPSNEGRGYVLRRIMRRAMRHAHQLGAKDPVMYKLFPKLIDLFGASYPELKRGEEFITSILQQEEERFKKTLDRGLTLLEEEVTNIKKYGILSADIAFKLYDTYGFPIDLTEDILKKQDVTVDHEGFQKQMQIQKDRARKAWVGSGESKTGAIWFDIASEFGSTEFLGYSSDVTESNTLMLVQNGKEVEKISDKRENFTLISNQTIFYGESGGQMGDIGFIISSRAKIRVINTLKYLRKIIGHVCVLEEGVISKNDKIKLTIDIEHRNNLRKHHSATHILHAVLRSVIGKHITQKGSLVASDKLRFDISHPQALTKEEIQIIENKVNDIIMENSEVATKLMSTEDAIKDGAMALFGEKYDSEVRVVSMGCRKLDSSSYSFELCGGTHVTRTGDIGLFKITSEGAIAAGVRRIEAVCGKAALDVVSSEEKLITELALLLKANKQDLLSKTELLINSKKDIEKQLEILESEKLLLKDSDITNQAISLGNARYIYKNVGNISAKLIRNAVQNITKQYDDLILIYISQSDEKFSITISISEKVSSFDAGIIAKKISELVGGSGGGQAKLAQVGGNETGKISELDKNIDKILRKV